VPLAANAVQATTTREMRQNGHERLLPIQQAHTHEACINARDDYRKMRTSLDIGATRDVVDPMSAHQTSEAKGRTAGCRGLSGGNLDRRSDAELDQQRARRMTARWSNIVRLAESLIVCVSELYAALIRTLTRIMPRRTHFGRGMP
jgi:hypothetical protein